MLAKARTAAREKGCENGVGAMTAEARVAACEKGNENRIGAMPADARTAAHEKGSKASSEASYDKMGIKWETQYAQFERCVVMPAEGTKLYTWQRIQLSTGPGGLDAKIRKQIAENEERNFLIALCKIGVNMRVN
jgi:hypothetical protein